MKRKIGQWAAIALLSVAATSSMLGYVLRDELVEQSSVVTTERCFLEHGPGVFTPEIVRKVGAGYTALVHCLSSKEALMVAALETNAAPICEQLLDDAKEISAFIQELRETLAVLHGASTRWEKSESLTRDPFRAITGWLRCAEKEGHMLKRHLKTLASTTLEGLHRWASTVRLCGASTSSAGGERHVERFVDLLWNGGKP